MSLSVVIITRNEEENIGRCLASVGFANEIIVIDSCSTDNTVEIAREHGAHVYPIEWTGYGPAKREAVRRATGEWILSIDADEVLSPDLAEEIQGVMSMATDRRGYYMRRKTQFMGKWIMHCGWYPDFVLRLFQASNGDFNDAVVHEKVILNGNAGHLKGELLHYSYPNLEHYLRKSNRYTTLGAEEAFRQGKKAGWTHLVVRPPIAFVKHYFIKQGFRDGLEGLVLSILSSVAVLVKYAKLRDLHRRARGNKA